jgi:hypothetical protein
MKDKSENQPSSEAAANLAAASAFASPDDLVEFASSYFASDFPNPGRLDCPPSDTLSALVHSGQLPDQKLRAHLFGCSECFKEYRSALAAYSAEMKEVASAESDSWWSRLLAGVSLRPIPVFAGVLSLVLLAFVGAYVWRVYRTAPDQVFARQDSAPVVAGSEGPSNNNLPSAELGASPSPLGSVQPITPQPVPKQTDNQRQGPVLPPVPRPSTDDALIAMAIALDGYSVTRGGAAASGGEIKFSPARTRLLLTLSEGAAKGLYSVSLVGASGDTLYSRNVRSADGKTLTTTLDMRGLTPQKFSLRISREGEPPINVPIVVTAAKTVSPVKKP